MGDRVGKADEGTHRFCWSIIVFVGYPIVFVIPFTIADDPDPRPRSAMGSFRTFGPAVGHRYW